MRTTVKAVASILIALTLAACGPEDTPTSHTPGPTAPAAPAYDAQLCDQIQAQKSVNQRLASDGYAADYSAQYDALLQSNGCP